MKTEAGNGDNVKFVAGAAGGEGSCYVFEADVTYVKSNNTTVSQIFFTSKSSFALNINYSNGTLRIWEHKQSGTRETLIEGVPADGVPIHFEIRYYPMERYAEIKLISCGVE